MQLDITTLMAAGSFVAALGGILLAVLWTQVRAARALLVWGTSHIVLSLGVALITYGTVTDTLPAMILGGTLNTAAPLLLWAGTRTFTGRPIRKRVIAAGFFLWGGVVAGSIALGMVEIVPATGFAIWFVALIASALELWRSRSEPLKARWPLMGIFALHAAIYTGGVYDALWGNLLLSGPAFATWFGFIHLENLLYVVGTSVFMVVLCKERSELGHIKAAQSDALTGIANRGGFFAGAERLMAQAIAEGTPLSVIVFDLDHFKSINDTYGHAVGDRVLGVFVEIVRATLRPNDFFGRQGGEEFGVFLPGATIETAYAIADRIRRNYAQAAREVGDLPIGGTVSAGIAAASLAATFSDALEAADRALYRSKNRGRNRVERADSSPADPEGIVRVA